MPSSKDKDGKIVAVARLQKVGSALLSSAAGLAGYAMLVQISTQIERLQGTVQQVLAKMDAARLGKVDAALAFLVHAHNFQPEHHTSMLLNAVQTLSEVLAGALHDVEQGIVAVPEPQEWNLTRAVWDTTASTAEALDRVAASMRVVLLCLMALGQAQLLLNGEDGAANIMDHWLRRALDLPLARAELLARRLPVVREEERRDRFWIDARQALARALERVGDTLDPDRPAVVQFNATGAQIADSLALSAQDAVPAEVVGVVPIHLRADPATRRR